jgi:DHA1 family bicyclomycin/chloramphenicol resistance-like MFS transporter
MVYECRRARSSAASSPQSPTGAECSCSFAAVGAAVLAASIVVIRETLSPERRVTRGADPHGARPPAPAPDRVFLGAVLVSGLVSAALFAYLAGATYVLQGIYRLSPQQYSFAFGLNSPGFMLFGYLGGRLAGRWSDKATPRPNSACAPSARPHC